MTSQLLPRRLSALRSARRRSLSVGCGPFMGHLNFYVAVCLFFFFPFLSSKLVPTRPAFLWFHSVAGECEAFARSFALTLNPSSQRWKQIGWIKKCLFFQYFSFSFVNVMPWTQFEKSHFGFLAVSLFTEGKVPAVEPS